MAPAPSSRRSKGRTRPGSNRRAPLYARDLAYIHHVGFGHFARQAAPELIQILRQSGVRRGTLVDLGCGSGLWARAALAAGFDVVGVDQSPAMVALATRTAPAAKFVTASLYDVALPPCAAVTILGEGLNYLPARGSAPAVGRLFRQIGRALPPGGVLIFDVLVRGREAPRSRHWQSGTDWAVLVQTREVRNRRRLTRSIITFRKIGAAWRRSEETHRVRVFSRAELAAALRRAGFSCRMTHRYGAYPLLPRRLAFVARKQR